MKNSSRGGPKTICMVAYTDYLIDARVRREAETLVRHGYRVVCITPNTGSASRNQKIGGVEVREVRERKYQGKSSSRYVLSYVRFLIQSFFRCTALYSRSGLDAVHVHNMPDFLVLAGLLPRLLGRNLVLDIHDSMPETYSLKFNGSSPFWFKLLCLEESLSCRLAQHVICVNEPQKEVLVGRGIPSEKILVSMNVPDHNVFRLQAPSGTEDLPPQESTEKCFALVYHGTMARRLGVDLIIEAVSRLAEEIPNLKLHLWGGGDDIDEFVRLSERLGVRDRVHFVPGGFPLRELPEKLAGMKVGVVGNRRSQATELMLPVKLLEYVSLKIPAVVPRLHTIDRYFDDQMMSFYEPGDVDSMAAQILKLHRNPGLRERQAQKAFGFLEEYGWARQQKNLLDFYRELLAPSCAPSQSSVVDY